jgi:tetratricopeptide (TPR) repeat protein
MHFLPTAQAARSSWSCSSSHYLTTIMVPYALRKPDRPGDARGYDWHFFVPCRDERAVIGRTLNRPRETSPAGHVWVIDDDSEDGTDEVVAEVMARHERIHCVRRCPCRPNARTGKGSALNSAYLALLPLVFARPDQARADAEALLARSPGPFEASIAHQVIGILERDFGDATAAVARLRTARRLAHRSGSADREADVLATLGIALVHAGRTRQGLDSLARGLSAAEWVTAARVPFRRAAILWVLGRHAEGLDDLRRAIPVLRRADDTIWTARALTLRGTIRLATGAAAQADLDFVAAEALWTTTDQDHDVAVAVENRGLVAARSGDIPAALTDFDEAARRYEALGTPMNLLHAERSGVLMAAGLAREALAEADLAVGLLERSGGQPTRRAELLLTAAHAALAAGALDVASRRAAAPHGCSPGSAATGGRRTRGWCCTRSGSARARSRGRC